MAILVKEMSNFSNSCKETQFFQILVHRMQKFGKFCLENANSWHFDVEISLVKGIIFRKIGLANGAILKQWAAHPCPKFSREPPPPVTRGVESFGHMYMWKNVTKNMKIKKSLKFLDVLPGYPLITINK